MNTILHRLAQGGGEGGREADQPNFRGGVGESRNGGLNSFRMWSHLGCGAEGVTLKLYFSPSAEG